MGGLNTITAGSAMNQNDCIQLKNMLSGEFGLKVRPGWLEWGNVADSTFPWLNAVGGIFGFNGSAGDGSKDRLFAASELGIFRFNETGGINDGEPDNKMPWTYFFPETGRCRFLTMRNSAKNWGILCDEANGYFLYDEDGGGYIGTGWNPAPAVTGVSAETLVYACVFKRRLWFVQRDSTKAWYLEADAVVGAATGFDFGAQFRNGGTLVALYNWTYEGGAGPDDRLVAISSSGDIVIYAGTDPSSADSFGIVGVWSVGGVVAGRNIATTLGGDLIIMSSSSLVPLSRLVVGAYDSSQYPTAKIQNLFRKLASKYGQNYGWSICMNPADNVLMITVPSAGSERNTTQLVMSIPSGSWSEYTDLPILSLCSWRGNIYFGTEDGIVGKHSGTQDAVMLANPSVGTAINWGIITAYSNLGTNKSKQVQMIRPLVSSDALNPRMEARAMYDLNVIPATGALIRAPGYDSGWDSATWDVGVWGGDSTISRGVWGTVGMGRHVALAIRGESIAETILMGADVDFTIGGEL
jgi:hypothetical protein